jgi:hypothetical protein
LIDIRNISNNVLFIVYDHHINCYCVYVFEVEREREREGGKEGEIP